MSTRAGISAKIKGKVYSIYCHHDGYPQYMIPILTKGYDTQKKVEALILEGDMSIIDFTLDGCRSFAQCGEPYKEIGPKIYDVWTPREEHYIEYEYYWNGNEWLYGARNFNKPYALTENKLKKCVELKKKTNKKTWEMSPEELSKAMKMINAIDAVERSRKQGKR